MAGHLTADANEEEQKPHWDKGKRILYFAGSVTKRYRRIAKNQQLVLDVFQELGWPDSIDDPLPWSDGADFIQRVNNTAKDLNKGYENELIGFRTNGDGTGFSWFKVEN